MDDNLLCLFSGRVAQRGGSFAIDVPETEVEIGNIEPGNTYRVALLSTGQRPTSNATAKAGPGDAEPPVEAGDIVEVTIENLGDQGDGIARVGPGYVVIVPDTTTGERVSIEIAEARGNVAFAEVVERYDTLEDMQ